MRITKKYVNNLSYEIVGCAIEVHKHLGPGLLESVYEECMIEELSLKGLEVESQVRVPIVYKGRKLDKYHILDLLVNDLIIVELKSVESILPLFEAQLLSYLRLADKPKGLLINFNCDNITQNLRPFVTKSFSQLPEF